MGGSKRRAIVCGTKFGRIYLKAFREPEAPFELAGILGQGSNRTRRCADHYNVPLLTKVDQVPDDVSVACVVVGGAVGGGDGATLAQALMARGIHVLQEHPLLPAEIGGCLRAAGTHKVQYHLNTHYVTLAPIRDFIAAARRLTGQDPPLFVDAACSIQVLYTLFDILGEALGGLRPLGFAPPVAWPETVRRLARTVPPYRSLDGVLAGIPFTLRVQNEIDPKDPDNYSHFLHRITIGGAGGCLTLVDTHGPVVWTPRLHLPASAAELPSIDGAPETYLDYPAVSPVSPAAAPLSHRQILGRLWPQGVVEAMTRLNAAIEAGDPPLARGQYALSVCEAWQQVTRLIGFPETRPGPALRPQPVDSVVGDPLALRSLTA